MSAWRLCYPNDVEGLRLLIREELSDKLVSNLWTLPTQDLLAFIGADDEQSPYNGFLRDIQAALKKLITIGCLEAIAEKRAWLCRQTASCQGGS